jgi:hypothetical protein
MKINDEQYKFIINGEDYHCALDIKCENSSIYNKYTFNNKALINTYCKVLSITVRNSSGVRYWGCCL